MEKQTMCDVPDDTMTRRGVRLIGPLLDAVVIMSRAFAAAHCYETLRAASDERLTRRGLTRSGVPRAVYHLLTGKD
jgi:hypothetical protein